MFLHHLRTKVIAFFSVFQRHPFVVIFEGKSQQIRLDYRWEPLLYFWIKTRGFPSRRIELII